MLPRNNFAQIKAVHIARNNFSFFQSNIDNSRIWVTSYYATLLYVNLYRKLRITVYCIDMKALLYMYVTVGSYLKN
jgi:hypothetical protein